MIAALFAAREGFRAASAAMARAQGYLRGPLTAQQKRTMLLQLDAAIANLHVTRAEVAAYAPDDDPIPRAIEAHAERQRIDAVAAGRAA
jgi:hypothetical protein